MFALVTELDPPIRKQLPLKPLELLVLVVVEESPLHGYAMVQRIAERTDGIVRVRPGDLYRVLYRLEKRGLLETTGSASADDDERRTYYRLTPLGKKVLDAEASLLRSVIAGVGRKKRESPT